MDNWLRQVFYKNFLNSLDLIKVQFKVLLKLNINLGLI